MATATVGTLGEFVELDGDWIEYVERLEHFFLANNIKEVERKRSILLSACGAKTYKLTLKTFKQLTPVCHRAPLTVCLMQGEASR